MIMNINIMVQLSTVTILRDHRDIFNIHEYMCSQFTTKILEILTYASYKHGLTNKTHTWRVHMTVYANTHMQLHAMWWKATNMHLKALIIDGNNKKPSYSLTISL